MGFGDRALDLVDARDVHLQGQDLAAERSDGIRDVSHRIQIAQPQSNIGAGLGQSDGAGAPDTARRARDQTDATF